MNSGCDSCDTKGTVAATIVAVIVIPFVGDLSDRIGRRPPMIVGSLAAGLLSFAYLYAISINNVPLAFVFSILMWGIVYQGYNAVYPSFYPELFPTRARVSGMAIAQNIGTMLTALLPALFATVAPPGSTSVPLTIGALAFGVTVIASIAAWSARETYRVHLSDLGEPGAVAVGVRWRRPRIPVRLCAAYGQTGHIEPLGERVAIQDARTPCGAWRPTGHKRHLAWRRGALRGA